MRRVLLLVLPFLLLSPLVLLAQNTTTSTPEMATALRSNGKIYVVVLVLATIFAGIITFLIYLERRLARLERDAKNSA